MHVLICLVALVPMAVSRVRAEPPTQPRVAAPAGLFYIGEKIEWTVADLPEAASPYNPAVIRIDAEIVSPDGKTVSVPGFAEGRCEPRQINGETRYQPIGGLDWRIRYAASAAGEYRAKVIVTVANTDRNGERILPLPGRSVGKTLPWICANFAGQPRRFRLRGRFGVHPGRREYHRLPRGRAARSRADADGGKSGFNGQPAMLRARQ